MKKKKYTEQEWKDIMKLPVAERYVRMVSIDGVRKYLKDKFTGMIYSEKRQAKKELIKTFASPTGRQLRKEKRYLKQHASETR